MVDLLSITRQGKDCFYDRTGFVDAPTHDPVREHVTGAPVKLPAIPSANRIAVREPASMAALPPVLNGIIYEQHWPPTWRKWNAVLDVIAQRYVERRQIIDDVHYEQIMQQEGAPIFIRHVGNPKRVIHYDTPELCAMITLVLEARTDTEIRYETAACMYLLSLHRAWRDAAREWFSLNLDSRDAIASGIWPAWSVFMQRLANDYEPDTATADQRYCMLGTPS